VVVVALKLAGLQVVVAVQAVTALAEVVANIRQPPP
jgi:hypothetical protein